MLDPIERHDLQREQDDHEEAVAELRDGMRNILDLPVHEVTVRDIQTLWTLRDNLRTMGEEL